MKWLVIVLFMVPAYAQTLNVVENEFVKIVTGPEGFDHPRFSIETTGGDPSRDNDNDMPLIYGRPKPWTSYTSIAVDNEVFGFGTQTLKRAGKSARYGQVVSSVVTNNAMTTTTQLGDVFATQTLWASLGKQEFNSQLSVGIPMVKDHSFGRGRRMSSTFCVTIK